MHINLLGIGECHSEFVLICIGSWNVCSFLLQYLTVRRKLSNYIVGGWNIWFPAIMKASTEKSNKAKKDKQIKNSSKQQKGPKIPSVDSTKYLVE